MGLALSKAVKEKDAQMIEQLASRIETYDEETAMIAQPILYEDSREAALCNFMIDTTTSCINTLYEAGLIGDIPSLYEESVFDLWRCIESHAEKTHTKPLVRQLLADYGIETK